MIRNWVGLLIGGLLVSGAHAEQPLAFPGAQGFAAHITGGRGGEVYHVTNLDDSGPGSLREAVSKGPRVVVFDVGGYIVLKSDLHVGNDLTIAGQTAPGEGIGIRNYEVTFSDSKNVICRYIRARQGHTPGEDHKSAINLVRASDILLDHVSVSWGCWDTIDMNPCTNVTIEYSVVGPGIDPQRFGCLCQGDGVTWTHNLFINNQSRNPKAKGRVQYINNVVYNWGGNGYVGGHSAADHPADLINNYFIAGPDSGPHFLGEFKATDHIFQSGNLVDLDRDGKLNGRPIVAADFGSGEEAPTLVEAKTITDDVPLKIESAEQAYQHVIAGAGDSLKRDALDRRLLADVQSLGKEGKVINDPSETGGFAAIDGSGQPKPIPPGDIERFLNDLAGDKP